MSEGTGGGRRRRRRRKADTELKTKTPHVNVGKNSLTCRLKSWKNNIFREVLLPAAARSKTASKKSAPGGTTPCL